MSNVQMQLTILALALGATTAAHAAPTIPIANISQLAVTQGTQSKIILYKNQDSIKTKTITTRTPVYGPAYNKDGRLIGTKFIRYNSSSVKSTTITPRSQLVTTDGKSAALSTPIVNFRFLASLPAAYRPMLSGNQNAYFELNAFSSSAPVNGGGLASQSFDSGTIKFIRTVPIQLFSLAGQAIGGPKSNLLTITFGNAVLAGQFGGTSSTLSAASQNSAITFTSDFLSFSKATDTDFSLAFNAAGVPITRALINASLTNVTGLTSLASTRSNVTGTFGASAVPEPASWAMMISGFALIGWRRRARRVVAA
jgi:hypothetical protein